MDLARHPRAALCHAPTPLEPLPALTALLSGDDGPQLWIKRDDCTGLATGGNKTRKLEFLMGAALEEDADTVITVGALQSNHCRQTAAAAARLGMRCVLLLEDRVRQANPRYRTSGNRFLDDLLGAEVRHFPAGHDTDADAAALVEQLRAEGRRPYVIPGGGSNPVGALGYVRCAVELAEQAYQRGISVDAVWHATGSTGTQAGLVAGFHGLQSDTRVVGVSVNHPASVHGPDVLSLARATVAHLGLPADVDPARVRVEDGFVGDGYGLPTPEMVEAVTLFARHEGVLLDPVYTGKAASALVAALRHGALNDAGHVVFLHTGGAVGLFAYEPTFAPTDA
jgi:L-cysteate sulfo-lyase